MTIISMQLMLDNTLPKVSGNKDYIDLEARLILIDRIFRESGIEELVMEHFLANEEQKSKTGTLSVTRTISVQTRAIKALRSAVLRKMDGVSLRKFCCDVASKPLFQWFIGINRFFGPDVFSKSTLEEWENDLPKTLLDSMNHALILSAGDSDGYMAEKAVNVSSLYYDTTCVPANIHYPVDWVLFRDAARSLMLAVACIRKSGIKHRMPSEPHEFISQMNSLCMTMSQSRRRKTSKKKRKRTLRRMKSLLKTIAGHAKRHRDKLESLGAFAKRLRPDAELIVSRIDNVLEQLPTAVRLAHERIIGGRRVKNSDKILSLYEPDVHVIVRGKSGAEVEFGNTLLLVEQSDGLIVDCRLLRDQSPGDPALLRESLELLEHVFGDDAIKSVCGDRGFDSPATRHLLDEQSLFNAVAARSVPALVQQMSNPEFASKRKRRAQTEGRIGIFKNCFLCSPMRQKGFEHREIHVGIGMLAHNLWKLARMILSERSALTSSA